MDLSELSKYQCEEFESPRGIVNHDDNLDRALDEWKEAKEQKDPLLRLEEIVDNIIVLAGGLGRICQREGLEYEYIDNLLKRKLEITKIKYDMSWFEVRESVETAQFKLRHYWKVDPDEWETDGDFY